MAKSPEDRFSNGLSMPEHRDSEPTVPPSAPRADENARTRTYAPSAPPGADIPASDHETKVQPAGADVPPSAAVPNSAGRYHLVREIGRGGMGIVLEAEDRELGRRLAVKVLMEAHQDDEALVRRFLDEARICGRLEHPGIVPIHELGRLPDRRPFFTMKLIQGQTLAALLQARRDPTDDLPHFLTIFEQACQTMAYAHSHGVIHRDLKPANIMVGNFGEVQVMDWGLAKVLTPAGQAIQADAPSRPADKPDLQGDSATSLAGTVMGTPGYMAPEQARGETGRIDARSDVFGLGAILCVILTGKPPYEATTHPEVHRQAVQADLSGAHARLSACAADAELVELARRCLAADPQDRPSDAGLVALAMTDYRASVAERLQAAELARASAQVKVVAERKARRLTLALAAAVIALLMLGGGGWFWREHERNEREHERNERRAKTARAAEQYVQRALRLREQGRAAAVGDLTALTEALDAAGAAADSLAGGDADPVLRQRVEDLLAQLKPELKNRRMRARLEEIRLNKSELKDDQFDVKRAVGKYASAFRDYGIDVENLPAEQAAEKIRRCAIAVELAAALDDWGEASGDAEERRRLLDLARQADADPWRQRLRAALAERDYETLVEAARSPEASGLPPATLYLLGKALADVGAPVASLRLLRKAQRLHPDDFWLNFQLAFQLANGKPPRPEEAIRYYTSALAVRKNSAGTHLSLGNAFQLRDLLDDAIAAYREVIRLQPKFATAHYNLANALNQKGQFDDAIAEYEAAIRLKPDYVQAYNNLGSLYADRDQLDKACTAYRKAIELKPDHANAHLNLARILLRLDRPRAALVPGHKVVELLPNEASAHETLGRILDALDRREEAMAAYQTAAAESAPSARLPQPGDGPSACSRHCRRAYRSARRGSLPAAGRFPPLPTRHPLVEAGPPR
jgi:tetratricopeptide (TPR) repeat protein